MPLKTVNLETGMPSTEDALRFLEETVRRAKHDRVPYLLVIHGYGSSGRGGSIGREVRFWLEGQKKCGAVRGFIFGEDFNLFNFDALRMKNDCPELSSLLRVCNRGVTVIEI